MMWQVLILLKAMISQVTALFSQFGHLQDTHFNPQGLEANFADHGVWENGDTQTELQPRHYLLRNAQIYGAWIASNRIIFSKYTVINKSLTIIGCAVCSRSSIPILVLK